MQFLLNKSLPIVLSFCLLISFYPVAASAAPSTSQIKPALQDDLFETVRQEYIEIMENLYKEFPPEYSYAPEIWSAMTDSYDEYMDIIGSAVKLEDIVEMAGGRVEPDERLLSLLYRIANLSEYTRDRYSGSSDLKELKRDLTASFNEIVGEIPFENYNQYNLDLLDEDKNRVKSSISNVDSISSYLDALDSFLRFSERMGIPDKDSDDEFDFILDDEEEEDIDDIYDHLSSDEKAYYSNSQLQEGVDVGYSTLCALAGTNGVYSGFKDRIQDFKKNAVNRYISSYQILIAYEKIFNDINDSITVNDFTRSDYMRYCDDMNTHFYGSYSKNNYSQNGYASLKDILDDYVYQLSHCRSVTEAKKLKAEYIKKFKGVKTLKQEIKALGDKYYRSLSRKYTNKKKYNQKKVAPLLKSAKTAFSRCATLSAVTSSYKSYAKKLDGTVYKFRVTVTRQGKGTVTGTKTVAYGSVYTLKATPSPGHRLKAVYIDGKKQKLKYVYKLKIYKARKVKVVFK